jgi:membrane-bound lytic murein transglycosylase A
MRPVARALALVVGSALLASCASIVPQSGVPAPRPAPAATPSTSTPSATAPGAANAAAAGVRAGPDIATLGLTPEGASRALAAFRTSCPSVQRRADTSGLAQPADWQDACAAAANWADTDAIRFFATYFRAVRVGDGKGLATGYYEPEIAGSRTAAPGYAVPVYRLPPDLVEVDLGQFSDSLAGRKVRGRVDGARLVPYFDRAAIDGGALAGRTLEIAWAADPVEFFFLQIQGSGRLRLPDGSVMRIGYAGQNGRDYTGIGRLLRDRGLIGPNEQSMQGIMAYLRRQPDGGRAVMAENKSWVFFRELTGPGPIGALGVPVVARASVAADPAFIPLGAPVLLATDRVEANGLWIAQDTGGAITGANRVDTFWGAGADARLTAGGMSGRGDVYVLLPVAAATRLTAGR